MNRLRILEVMKRITIGIIVWAMIFGLAYNVIRIQIFRHGFGL
jgi:hypothetical protein